MMMTSSKQKLWPFCQLVLSEFSVFPIESFRGKETAVIPKCINQLHQNLAKVHNLVPSFDVNHKNFQFFYSYNCFRIAIRILLFVFCSNFDALSGYKKFIEGQT